jgi:hypothetical protein
LVELPESKNYLIVSLTYFRMLLHTFFAAAKILLLNLARNPRSTEANSDLHIIKPFLHLLEILAGDQRMCSRSEEFKRMSRISIDLMEEARVAVQHLVLQTMEDMAT